MGKEGSFLECIEGLHETVYDTARAETVCGKCGLVLGENPLEFDAGLVILPRRRRDVHGGKGKCSRHYVKRSPLQRTLAALLSNINPTESLRNLSIKICNSIDEQGFARGYPNSTLSKTIVYTAYRLGGTPILVSDLALTHAEDQRKIIRCHNRLCRKLELRAPRIQYSSYLVYLARKKTIRGDIIALANSILRKAKENNVIKGANPIGTAATALYLAGIANGQKLSQKELAKLAGVSEVTIRADCKILQKVAFKESKPNT